MAYFLPSSFQKRLLRYALSRAQLLDTDALGLENLDIAWGQRSTVELRDVGLKLKKLSTLLHLPENLEVNGARVALLRITVPADIYSSPIQVEIEGVNIHAHLPADGDAGLAVKSSDPGRASRGQSDKSKDVDRPTRQPATYDPGGKFARGVDLYVDDSEDDDEGTLPTAADLAASFLETRPAAEKTQLAAVVASQTGRAPNSHVGVTEEREEEQQGTGTALSLPGFLTRFLKSITDRLQISVKNIEIKLDVTLALDTADIQELPSKDEVVTIQLRIEEINVDGVVPRKIRVSSPESAEEPENHTARLSGTPADDFRLRRLGQRNIGVRSASLSLLSTPSVFESYSRSSGPPSPVVAHASASSTSSAGKSRSSKGTLSRPSFPPSASQDEVPISSTQLGHPTILPEEIPIEEDNRDLVSSVMTNEESKFADAPAEDDSDGENIPFAARVGTGRSVEIATSSGIIPRQSLHESVLDNNQDSQMFASSVGSDSSEPPPSLYAPDVPQTEFVPEDDELDASQTREVSLPLRVREEEVEHGSVAPSRSSAGQKRLEPSQKSFQGEEGGQLGRAVISEAPKAVDTRRTHQEDLSESRIFSHEEAQSMYMSALSEAPAKSPQVNLSEPEEERLDNESATGRESGQATSTPPGLATGTGSIAAASQTPEAISPTQSKANPNASPPLSDVVSSAGSGPEPRTAARLAKTFAHVKGIEISVPVQSSESLVAEDADATAAVEESQAFGATGPAASTYSAIPGAFIPDIATPRPKVVISKPSSSTKDPTAFDAGADEQRAEPSRDDGDRTAPVTVSINDSSIHFDAPLAKLAIAVAQVLKERLSGDHKQERASEESRTSNPPSSTSSSSIEIIADVVSLQLLDRLVGTSHGFEPPSTASPLGGQPYQPSTADVLLRAAVQQLKVAHRVQPPDSTLDISVGKAVLGYAKDDIISFDARHRMRFSTRDLQTPKGKDISISVSQSPGHSKVTVATLPVLIDLDLQRLDETSAWFGGFSSILGLGTSIASLATVTPSGPPASTSAHPRRTVRFAAPGSSAPAASRTSSPQYKVDVRVDGAVVNLKGRECSIRLDTSAVKLVSRQEGIRAQVDRMKLSGPFSADASEDPDIALDLGNMRLDYLPFPKEVDLARLLSLLSPANNRYETEDDILVETLLRQRKQGPVLRVTLATVGGHANRLNRLERLSTLGEEIAKLSSVTKYLPEDDRAGILTLGLVQTIDVEADFENKLGKLQVLARALNVAHVSVPSLLAGSIQSIQVHQNNEEELIGASSSVPPAEGESRPPMIMARMIGDEMEPTLKLKLDGVRVEYTVPVLEALSDSSSKATPSTMDLPQSAGILDDEKSQQPASPHQNSPELADEKRSSTTSSDLPRIDIALHNCVVGLNPLKETCRGALVLTDTRLSGSASDREPPQFKLDVKMSSLLIIDDVGRAAADHADAGRGRAGSGTSDGSVVSELSSLGYVPVGYISSAKIVVKQHQSSQNGKKSLDVELNDNLLVLESCADSTQTLFSLFNGLQLPQAPNNDIIKYRTEVVPVQDMLASLSGDAFTTVNRPGQVDELPVLVEDPLEAEQDPEYVSGDEDSDVDLDIPPQEFLDQSSIEEDAPEMVPNPAKVQDTRPLQESDNQPGASPEPLQFEEDHFGGETAFQRAAHKWDSTKNTYGLAEEYHILGSPLRVRIRDVHVIWNLFDGYDWPKTRDAINLAVKEVTDRAIEKQALGERGDAPDDDESVIGDFLFNSIYIGIPANRDPKDLSHQIQRDVNDFASESEVTSTTSRSPARQGPVHPKHRKGMRLGRSKRHKMAFELRGIAVDLIVFPPGSGETESVVDVRVREFEIMDHVPTSTWRKFATYMHDAGVRESGTDMLRLEILSVRPIPELAASEMVVKVDILPLRLHVDQDALDFLTRFFEFRDDATPVQPPSSSDMPFLQRVEINAVRVRLDYKPKKVDYGGLRSGHTTEFMNFFILDQADMVLRHVIIYGVAGLDRLSTTLNDIWMPDIKRNQLPGVLAGLAPVRSLVNVGGGVRDLVVVPLQEYQKDGRLVRSIKKGALAFAKTTSSELVKLGAKLAIRTQTVLQGAEEMLNPASPSSHAGWEDAGLEEEEKRTISLYADQPVGVMQGLRGAYGSLERDLLTARDAIVAMPGEVLESGSAQGAAKAVIRRAPTIIFRPAIGASKAISQTLMGATNSLDPQHRRRMEEKYKHR